MILGSACQNIGKLESGNEKTMNKSAEDPVPDNADSLVQKLKQVFQGSADLEELKQKPEDEMRKLKGEVVRLRRELMEKSYLDKITREQEQRNLEVVKQKMRAAFKDELLEERGRLEVLIAERQSRNVDKIHELTETLKSTVQKLEVTEQKLREESERADVNKAHALVSEGRVEQMKKAQKARRGDKEGAGCAQFFQPICMICRFELGDSPGKVPKVLG